MSLFTRTTMAFVDMREIEDGVHVFAFAPAKPLAFVAGQHGIFRIAGVTGRRSFSLASAPEDPRVVIATRLQSRSDFKLALAALRPGDPVTLNGPILNFTLRDTPDDVVFLAQGIGITPFRSILRHIAAADVPKRTHLVHVAGTDNPPFPVGNRAARDHLALSRRPRRLHRHGQATGHGQTRRDLLRLRRRSLCEGHRQATHPVRHRQEADPQGHLLRLLKRPRQERAESSCHNPASPLSARA